VLGDVVVGAFAGLQAVFAELDLRVMTTLPMSDPDAAVAELQRTANAPLSGGYPFHRLHAATITDFLQTLPVREDQQKIRPRQRRVSPRP
jgi:hypothetical protein